MRRVWEDLKRTRFKLTRVSLISGLLSGVRPPEQVEPHISEEKHIGSTHA